jgi:hypothetical protein
MFVFADMACGCSSRASFVSVTETVLSLFQGLFDQFPLLSVLSCFHFHTAGTWTSSHYPYVVGLIVQL